ncbi:MAG: AAA family ATPase [Succinivibrionaceae bacterium]|nr:AAA family ATPase [Succinivibrionaceae bacterium]
MFNSFYGLEENPFSHLPDPGRFFPSSIHSRALDHIVKRLACKDTFVLLSGEHGLGKTTIAMQLSQWLPRGTITALVQNPGDTPRSLFTAICDELRIPYTAESPMISLFNSLRGFFYLMLKRAKPAVIVIDNADSLSETLIRLLDRLAAVKFRTLPIVRIVLIGSWHIEELPLHPALRAIFSDLGAPFRLEPLQANEVEEFISSRLRSAGCDRNMFDPSAIKMIATLSGGVPAVINRLAESSLMAAAAANSRFVTTYEVNQAVGRVNPPAVAAALAEESENDRTFISVAEDNFFSFRFVYASAAVILGIFTGVMASAINGPVMPIQETEPAVQEQLIDNTAEYKAVKKVENQFKINIRKSTDAAAAMKFLFRVWGYKADGITCQTARYAKLACYTFHGAREELANLNHPAVITLYDQTEMVQFYAVVIAIGRDTSTLLVRGKRYEVNNTWLDSRWDGEAMLLWRLLPSGNAEFTRNSGTVDLEYMNSALKAASGKRNFRVFTGLDKAMTDAIKDFQKKEHLKPDGVAGGITLLLLNARGGAVMPRLTD